MMNFISFDNKYVAWAYIECHLTVSGIQFSAILVFDPYNEIKAIKFYFLIFHPKFERTEQFSVLECDHRPEINCKTFLSRTSFQKS